MYTWNDCVRTFLKILVINKGNNKLRIHMNNQKTNRKLTNQNLNPVSVFGWGY